MRVGAGYAAVGARAWRMDEHAHVVRAYLRSSDVVSVPAEAGAVAERSEWHQSWSQPGEGECFVPCSSIVSVASSSPP